MKNGQLDDIQSEHAMLSAIFADPTVLEAFPITAGLFQGKMEARVASALGELHRTGQEVTPHAVGIMTGEVELENISLKVCTRAVPVKDVRMHFERLEDLMLRRRLSETCNKFYQAAYDLKNPVSPQVSEFEGAALQVRPPRTRGDREGWHFGSVIEKVNQRWSQPGTIEGLRFGFPQIEQFIDGLKPRRYYVIAARPSVGKSAFMLCMLAGLCRAAVKCGVISMEMGAGALKQRLLAIESRVPVFDNRATFDATAGQVVADAGNRLAQWRWWVQDDRRMDIGRIEHQLRTWKQMGVQVAFIDYLQKVSGDRRDMRTLISEASTRLAEMADELGIAIVCLAQLKRLEGYLNKRTGQNVYREPSIDDLKESGAIEEDADMVGLISRDQQANAQDAKFLIGKQREGPTGSVILSYNPSTTTFWETGS